MKMKVEGHPDLIRNESGAIVNTNAVAYKEYLSKFKTRNDITNVKDDIENLRKELSELKDLIKKVFTEKEGCQ
jgi:hypothetical protein